MEKKYILTEETLEYDNRILHRIKAVKDFGKVKEGDLGGWIESKKNLAQSGDCWVGGEAKVFGNSKVRDNAWVGYHAQVSKNAKVYGNAIVDCSALVTDNAIVGDNAWVGNNADVGGNAQVLNNAWVYGKAIVSDNARVFENGIVFENAKICGNCVVLGHAYIGGDAIVTCHLDYKVFHNNWSSGRYFTWTKSNNKWRVGCFYGTGKELIEKAYKDSEEKGWYYEQFVKFNEKLANHESLE